MDEVKIYLDLPKDIKRLLDDNDIDIADILQNNNIDAQTTFSILPYQTEEGARGKDLVMVVLTGISVVAAVISAISNTIEMLHSNPHQVEVYGLKHVKNKEGKTKLKPVKQLIIDEPTKIEEKRTLEFSFGIPKGIIVKFTHEKKAVNIKTNITSKKSK